jgi:uncharacterized membrane protein
MAMVRSVLFPVTAVFLLWTVLLALRYRAFDFWDWDLAVFSHTLWNLGHGNPHNAILNVHVLGNHANFLAYPLAPLYALCPHPVALLTLKAFCVIFAAVPLYLLAERELPRPLPECLVLAYLLYAPLTNALSFEFDFEALSPFFLMWLWYAFLTDRRRLFLLVGAGTLLLKENMALSVAMFGLAGAVRYPERRGWWLAVCAAAVAWFGLVMFVIVPWARGGGGSIYWFMYGHLGRSPADILWRVASDPGRVFQLLWAPVNRWWLWQLFSPVALMGVLGVDYALLGAPLFLQNMLSSAGPNHAICCQYVAALTPFVFIGSLYGMKRLLGWLPKIRWVPSLLGGVLVGVSLVTQLLWGPLLAWALVPDALIRDDLDVERAALIRRVPPSASVLATFQFLPALSTRPHLYTFRNFSPEQQPAPFVLPEGIEYVLADLNDAQLRSKLTYWPNLPESFYAFDSPSWGVEAAVDSLVLLRRSAPAALPLYELLPEASSMEQGDGWSFEGGMALAKPSREILSRGRPGEAMPLELIWSVVAPIDRPYAVILTWFDDDGRVRHETLHPIGYRMFPPSRWPMGRLVRETLYPLVPRLLPVGRYRLVAGVLDELDGHLVPIAATPEQPQEVARVLLGMVLVIGQE